MIKNLGVRGLARRLRSKAMLVVRFWQARRRWLHLQRAVSSDLRPIPTIPVVRLVGQTLLLGAALIFGLSFVAESFVDHHATFVAIMLIIVMNGTFLVRRRAYAKTVTMLLEQGSQWPMTVAQAEARCILARWRSQASTVLPLRSSSTLHFPSLPDLKATGMGHGAATGPSSDGTFTPG